MSSFVGLCGGTKWINGVCCGFPRSTSVCLRPPVVTQLMVVMTCLESMSTWQSIGRADNSLNGVLDGQPVKHRVPASDDLQAMFLDLHYCFGR
eukprot:10094140-Ditylum_brightwellii.AAC.1